MQLGMIGLGRMGANMVRRLLRDGHECVVHDIDPDAVRALADEGAIPALSPDQLTAQLDAPRALWMMVPVAHVAATIETFAPLLDAGDILVDGGNTRYHDDIRRARELQARQYSLRRRRHERRHLGPGAWLLPDDRRRDRHRPPPRAAIRVPVGPAVDSCPRHRTVTRIGHRGSTAEHGPTCIAGRMARDMFVKMVHNGIEYGLMAAYAEGMNILRHANEGLRTRDADAETTPLEHPEHYQYDLR